MNDGLGPAVSQERRKAERVQDAVGLKITRLQDEAAPGGSCVSHGEVPSTIDGPTHKISLSEVGLAFAHDELLRPGELLTVDIMLFPSRHVVHTDGRVVSANDASEIDDGDKPTYRIAFESLTDSDRDLIKAQVHSLLQQRPATD